MFSGYLLVLLSVSAVGALVVPAPIERRAISSDLLSQFNLAEQYAAAAYCPNNNDSPNTKLTCSAGNCPLVESANTDTLAEFENTPETDSTGYVAVSQTDSLIVISFRGSVSIRNWLADINFPAVNTGLCDGCTAAQGFWSAWQEVRSPVIAALKQAKQQYPNYKIISTGHSLGGALATLAAAELRTLGYDVTLYSFGSPRVASATLSSFISKQPGGNYRLTHLNDPVPKLPPLLAGFVHISPEYYISSANNVTVTTADVNVYQGAINFSGNTGQFSIDSAAHTWYLGPISSCAPDEFELKARSEHAAIAAAATA